MCLWISKLLGYTKKVRICGTMKSLWSTMWSSTVMAAINSTGSMKYASNWPYWCRVECDASIECKVPWRVDAIRIVKLEVSFIVWSMLHLNDEVFCVLKKFYNWYDMSWLSDGVESEACWWQQSFSFKFKFSYSFSFSLMLSVFQFLAERCNRIAKFRFVIWWCLSSVCL